ncbi:MAG: carboxypeptidase-like regulatory domain-containing protein, partial [Terracidiphilus sp.]
MRVTKKASGLLASVVLLAPFCIAGTITGTVKGPDGAPFEGAFIEAQNLSTKITTNVLSHKDGRYHVDSLPAGDYDLHIRAIGYKGDPHDGVKLAADQKASFDFSLEKGMVRWSDLSTYQG